MAETVSEAASALPVLAEIQVGAGLSLSAAGRLFPGHRGGASVDPSTVFRWVTKGARAGEGRVVKLEAARVGGRWLTSREAVARFVAALTEAATPAVTPVAPTTRAPAAHTRATEKAVAALKKMGA
ncbi:hypothetical protein GobsT_49540 [Gemmata obscuriglobus]|uniref:DUF1580 domain-containing protein n=1 Tax=Gemmata obscuriglobus TaxID=114 RepID=A0A2Z3GYJ9_9BACT|nr:DUF1580 domain-containing protein [Gemmata obscuriglobus]AWM37122.1 DUF1580 domain-containing protein [Gemmata obscuriglobus]QEG30152.1 hypothetical protein GobsT_49540 [Gemmata obscuriglobus]VTS09473.1 : DUF1580 [Gemmata obscuriglobus UQM 2246]